MTLATNDLNLKRKPGPLSRVAAWVQTERGLVVLAVVVGLLLRILAQPLSAYIGDDSDDYGAFARGLMVMFAGDGWRETPAATGGYGYSPAYPLVTAVLSYITGSVWVSARAISLVSGLAVIYATYVFGRDLFGSRVGIIAGWIIAVSSVMVGQSARTATEMLFVLGVLIGLIALLRNQRSMSGNPLKSRSMWLTGIAFAVAAMTRPEGFVIGGVIVVFVVWQSRRLTSVLPVLIPGIAMMGIWASSGFLTYFIDHYRGVNSAVDAGLTISKFAIQLASQGFHVVTGNITSLGLVVLVLAGIGLLVAGRQRVHRETVVLLAAVVIFVGLFLIVTPGLGDMNRYIAVMVPILAVFAGYGAVYSIDLLNIEVGAGSSKRWIAVVAMGLIVLSVFNPRAIGERSLTWDAVTEAQSTALDWIDGHANSENVKILDHAGIGQVRFADDPDSYQFVTDQDSDLSELPAGYDYVVVQQPVGKRHDLPDQYVAAVDITASQGYFETLVYTIFLPVVNDQVIEHVHREADDIDTIWNRFWNVD
jgi:hypothetical protein